MIRRSGQAGGWVGAVVMMTCPPNAPLQVVTSTWDEFTSLLPAVEANMPVVTSEIGDSW